MKTIKKGLKGGLMAGLITFMASPAFARSISLEGAGTALWIFIIIGAIVILLQLIPAAMVSIAVMQVVSTVEDIGPMIYIVGGAVALIGFLIPLMMVIMIKRLQKGKE